MREMWRKVREREKGSERKMLRKEKGREGKRMWRNEKE